MLNTSSELRQVPTAEVMNEYGIIMINSASVGTRRQVMNNVYVGLNTVFLSGLGVLLISSHLNSWRTTLTTAVVTIIVLPINWAWYRGIQRYRRITETHYDAMREMEGKYIFAADLNIRLLRVGASTQRAETFLACYFMILYPVIAIGVAIVSFLIIQQVQVFVPQ